MSIVVVSCVQITAEAKSFVVFCYFGMLSNYMPIVLHLKGILHIELTQPLLLWNFFLTRHFRIVRDVVVKMPATY